MKEYKIKGRSALKKIGLKRLLDDQPPSIGLTMPEPEAPKYNAGKDRKKPRVSMFSIETMKIKSKIWEREKTLLA